LKQRDVENPLSMEAILSNFTFKVLKSALKEAVNTASLSASAN